MRNEFNGYERMECGIFICARREIKQDYKFIYYSLLFKGEVNFMMNIYLLTLRIKSNKEEKKYP